MGSQATQREGKRNGAKAGKNSPRPSKPRVPRSIRGGRAVTNPGVPQVSAKPRGKASGHPQADVSGLQVHGSDEGLILLPERLALSLRRRGGVVYAEARGAARVVASSSATSLPDALADLGRGILASLARSDAYRLPLTIAGAAAELGVSEAFVLDEILNGPLRAWKGEGGWRIERLHLDAYRDLKRGAL